ncbi:MAG: ABC transporter permease [Candidatus Eisenbacteria bacterium]|jgi:lipoprotein-releasing system permease protein|nr:ABC transporter permease [Candidatus Eisenbacteria bacterium]
MGLALILSRRYLHHPGGRRRLSGLVAVAGVAAGVTMLVVVMAVLNGLATDLRSRITRTESHIRITRSDGLPAVVDSALVVSLAGQGRLVGMARFVQGELLLIHHGKTAGALLYGIDMASPGRGEELRSMLRDDGSCASGTGGLVLGSLLAQRIWAVPGDTVLLATPRELMPRPGGRPPRLARRVVDCVFTSGLPDFDASLAFMPTDQAVRLLEGQSAPGVELWLRDPADAPRVSRRLAAALATTEHLEVRHWGELNRSLFDALRLEKLAMFVVLALVICIAGLNITGGILRNVIARRTDIAILMTMGCTRTTVLAVFLLEGMLIGVAGAALGSTLGVGLGAAIERSGVLTIPGDLMPFAIIPMLMRAGDLGWVCIASVFITTASAVYPAYRASRLDPVSILRDL